MNINNYIRECSETNKFTKMHKHRKNWQKGKFNMHFVGTFHNPWNTESVEEVIVDGTDCKTSFSRHKKRLNLEMEQLPHLEIAFSSKYNAFGLPLYRCRPPAASSVKVSFFVFCFYSECNTFICAWKVIRGVLPIFKTLCLLFSSVLPF